MKTQPIWRQRHWRLVLAGGTLSLFLFLIFLFLSLPSPRHLRQDHYPASTLIYDRRGQLLYEFYAQENRVPISLNDIPDHLVKATIAIEDKNFWHHHGLDFRGIARAFYQTVFRHRLEGGSTITQQLVKNALLSPQRTLGRKIKEVILTVLTELLYNKKQILTMYFNQTPYGGTAWGIAAAAKTYFNKKPADLNLAEAALLAGLPAAPSRFSPFIHPDLARQRQRLVLKKMLQQHLVSRQEYDKALATKLHFANPPPGIKAPHFVFYIKEKLVQQFGRPVVEKGGLRVKTSLDWKIQQKAETVVAKEIAKLKAAHISNGAALVLQPKTGEILAMVGSKNYFARDIDGKFNVVLARRQPGSAIKPLNYVTGLALHRVTPASIFNDMPTCFLVSGQKPYCPTNYDLLFHGPVQLRYALGNSFNIPAVKMLALNGLDTFIASASAMGITTFKDPSRYGLSLTLGGGEVRMIDLATAFATLANLGRRQNPVGILEVRDSQGHLLWQYQPRPGPQAVPQGAAWLISHILADNGARTAAFGPHSWLVIAGHPEVAVKTGTTNDKRDNWTIGYTPSFLTAVWVGNNDNSPMSYVASGVTGASPIWQKIMRYLLKNRQPEWPPRPATIIGRTISNVSGQLPEPGEKNVRFEYFLRGTAPQKTATMEGDILINDQTGQPVQPGEKITASHQEHHRYLRDTLGTIYCFDCPPAPANYHVAIHYPLAATPTPRP